MNSRLKKKYEELLEYLSGFEGLAVAFSGGVDSAFLLYAAREALGDKVLALTIKSSYIPDWEIKEAKQFTADRGIRHLIIDAAVPEQIRNNPEDRCYLCKTYLFAMLRDVAVQNGLKHIADGTNADDTRDHRPGMKALKELKVLSPLMEKGFAKQDIRDCSRDVGLETWEKPAYACLLTRMPYGTRVEEAMLRRIEKSETYLIEQGIRAVRVRSHGDLARIETAPRYMDTIFRQGMMKRIAGQLSRYGFKHVTLDLQGYRTGGFDRIYKDNQNDTKG
jgi:uncharacterized protein